MQDSFLSGVAISICLNPQPSTESPMKRRTLEGLPASSKSCFSVTPSLDPLKKSNVLHVPAAKKDTLIKAAVSAHLKDEVAAESETLHFPLLPGSIVVGDAEVLITDWKVVGLQYSQRVLGSVV